MNLKISVLSSGDILLDGKPVDLAQLDEALRAGKETNATARKSPEQGIDRLEFLR